MDGYREFIGPIVGSNLFALGLLALAWWRPTAARATIGVGFLVAAVANAVVVTVNEASYIDYANWAAGPYARFIEEGWFARYTQEAVLVIAVGQATAGWLTLTRGTAARIGLAGTIAFLLAISPLGAGAAFPSTVIMAAAAGLVLLSGHVDEHLILRAMKRIRRRDAGERRAEPDW